MAFKLLLLKHYLQGKKIIYVISHDFSVYLGMILKYFIILASLFFLYRYLNNYVSGWLLNWIFALGGVILYGFFVVRFMDLYLDSIVLTSTGLVIFLWDGLFKYQVQNLDRDRVDIVKGTQSGILDMIFNKGNLMIEIEETKYKFTDVSHPRKQSQMIIETKEALTRKQEDSPVELDKFDVFVETLGEVIVDYIKNNKNKSSETYFG